MTIYTYYYSQLALFLRTNNLRNNTVYIFYNMKKYKKPKLDVLEIELNCNIALQSVNKGSNLNTGFNGNGYSEKVIGTTEQDISDTWGDSWDNRGSL